MDIFINCAQYTFPAILTIPKLAKGLVIFVHGSGSSRFSPRNQWVAQYLNQYGFVTLLFDLLTAEEEEIDVYTAEHRFDIPLLTERLINVTHWCSEQEHLKQLPIFYFGASTGCGAAILAATQSDHAVEGVICRGGRADLAGDALKKFTKPSLLIVGGNDFAVLELNQKAMMAMTNEVTLHVVNGATHLFEEKGTLEEVAQVSKDWLMTQLKV